MVACNQSPIIETTQTPVPAPSEDSGVQTRDIYTGTRLAGITGARFATFYDISVSNAGYIGTYDTARASWNQISSKVAIDKSTTYAEANDQYFVSDSDRSPINGETIFLFRNPDGTYKTVTANNNFHHSQVVLYNGSFLHGYPDPNVRAYWIRSSAIHEVGHSLLQAHNSQAPGMSIMRPDSDSSGVTTYDRGELIRKWGQ